MKSTCTLPPLADLLLLARSPNMDSQMSGYYPPIWSPRPSSPSQSLSSIPTAPYNPHPLKAKRKRASAPQLAVLNRVFSQTYFPSTELRIDLGKQLNMSPRTVQIWFQNKRQALRTRGKLSDKCEYFQENDHHHHYHYQEQPQQHLVPLMSPPRSPPSSDIYPHFHPHSNHSLSSPHSYQNEISRTLPPARISLPPLRLSPSSYPHSPVSPFPSPDSIYSIFFRE